MHKPTHYILTCTLWLSIGSIAIAMFDRVGPGNYWWLLLIDYTYFIIILCKCWDGWILPTTIPRNRKFSDNLSDHRDRESASSYSSLLSGRRRESWSEDRRKKIKARDQEIRTQIKHLRSINPRQSHSPLMSRWVMDLTCTDRQRQPVVENFRRGGIASRSRR